jgi:hypothetical protein
MAERQHELEDERRQRQPRAEFKVFSKPIHAALRVSSTQMCQCYIITWKANCNVNS